MKTNDVETRTANSGHADHRRALRRSCRWFCRIALPSGADFCGDGFERFFHPYERKSISMCGVVFDFDGSCMDCGKTGEVGTDDFRKRDSAGGRGDSREAFPKLETSATGKICRRIFVYAGRSFLGREGPSIQLGAMARLGDIQSFGTGEKEKRSF